VVFGAGQVDFLKAVMHFCCRDFL